MTTTQTLAWWRTAANPSCPEWCTSEHGADEFAEGGAFLCTAKAAGGEGQEFTVEVQLCRFEADSGVPGEIQSDPMTIWAHFVPEEMTSDAGERYARGLMAAVEMIHSVS